MQVRTGISTQSYGNFGLGRTRRIPVPSSLQQPVTPEGDRSPPGHHLALLVGDADYPPLIEADRQAAARIPGCELTVAPGMDHLPPLREPDLVLHVINSTLSRAGW